MKYKIVMFAAEFKMHENQRTTVVHYTLQYQRLFLVYAPVNGLHQDGGFGQPRENLTFSGFQISISPPLGLHHKSHSHP